MCAIYTCFQVKFLDLIMSNDLFKGLDKEIETLNNLIKENNKVIEETKCKITLKQEGLPDEEKLYPKNNKSVR